MESIFRELYRMILIISSLMIFSACGDSGDKYPFILEFEKEDNPVIYNIGHNSFEVRANGGTLRINGSVDFTVDAVAIDDSQLSINKTSEIVVAAPEAVRLLTVDNKNIQIIFYPNNTGKLRKFEIILHPEWDEDVKLTYWQLNVEESDTQQDWQARQGGR